LTKLEAIKVAHFPDTAYNHAPTA